MPYAPYCQVHLADQVLSSASVDEQLSRTIKKLISWPEFTRAERLILVLTYFNDFPMTAIEIGATLDLSESTIRRMLRRLLQRISPYLQDASEVLYPFSPYVEEQVIIGIREFSNELISYLAKHPDQLYHFEPRRFERLIAHLLRSSGFDVELTAPVRDGGCDIVAFNADSLGIKTKYIIECKRYRPDCPVGVRLVRSLYGIKDINQAQHAILATTSYFTRDAIAFAKAPSILGLHLKDFKHIREWLIACASGKPEQTA